MTAYATPTGTAETGSRRAALMPDRRGDVWSLVGSRTGTEPDTGISRPRVRSVDLNDAVGRRPEW